MRNYLLISISLCIPLFFSYGQSEKIVIEGAIVISNNDDPSPTPGTIRWTGTRFEGWTGSQWVSLDFSTTDEQDGDATKGLAVQKDKSPTFFKELVSCRVHSV